MNSIFRLKNKQGFNVAEIMTAIAVFAIFFVSIYQALLFYHKSMKGAVNKVTAIYLAQEGIEAVRSLRNKSWTDNIAALNEANVYYPILNEGEWALSTTNPGPIDGAYIRTVVVDKVFRNGLDDIDTAGSEDPKTKKIQVKIAWNEPTGSKEIIVETYLTNFLAN